MKRALVKKLSNATLDTNLFKWPKNDTPENIRSMLESWRKPEQLAPDLVVKNPEKFVNIIPPSLNLEPIDAPDWSDIRLWLESLREK